jgi:hypothetical protein
MKQKGMQLLMMMSLTSGLCFQTPLPRISTPADLSSAQGQENIQHRLRWYVNSVKALLIVYLI